MAWAIEFQGDAERELRRLDPVVVRRILTFLYRRVAEHPNPRVLGESLKGEFVGIWRWRVGDYRVLGRIEAEKLVIAIVAVDHRKQVYR